MIKTLTKDIEISLYHNIDNQKCWRSKEFFVRSDYNALKEYYYSKYPTISVAAMIKESYETKQEYYQIILMFDEESDAAEFILKECNA